MEEVVLNLQRDQEILVVLVVEVVIILLVELETLPQLVLLKEIQEDLFLVQELNIQQQVAAVLEQ